MSDKITRVHFAAIETEGGSWKVLVGFATMRESNVEFKEMPPMPSYDAALSAIALSARMLRTEIATKLTDRMDYAARVAAKTIRGGAMSELGTTMLEKARAHPNVQSELGCAIDSLNKIASRYLFEDARFAELGFVLIHLWDLGRRLELRLASNATDEETLTTLVEAINTVKT